jgi:hypothetical protein
MSNIGGSHKIENGTPFLKVEQFGTQLAHDVKIVINKNLKGISQ